MLAQDPGAAAHSSAALWSGAHLSVAVRGRGASLLQAASQQAAAPLAPRPPCAKAAEAAAAPACSKAARLACPLGSTKAARGGSSRGAQPAEELGVFLLGLRWSLPGRRRRFLSGPSADAATRSPLQPGPSGWLSGRPAPPGPAAPRAGLGPGGVSLAACRALSQPTLKGLFVQRVGGEADSCSSSLTPASLSGGSFACQPCWTGPWPRRTILPAAASPLPVAEDPERSEVPSWARGGQPGTPGSPLQWRGGAGGGRLPMWPGAAKD
ncbi:translation initiation factor IF-2-like [Hemicordylus capensis]|uniref:translation initiation factor IF-2-like n=1 Tax=Hemicordylus capensis TaxID=884348 RepID=UPI00230313D8|nr:translation initiation factor IF-2-like [Hemicordylus capensis]